MLYDEFLSKGLNSQIKCVTYQLLFVKSSSDTKLKSIIDVKCKTNLIVQIFQNIQVFISGLKAILVKTNFPWKKSQFSNEHVKNILFPYQERGTFYEKCSTAQIETVSNPVQIIIN